MIKKAWEPGPSNPHTLADVLGPGANVRSPETVVGVGGQVTRTRRLAGVGLTAQAMAM
jgi:hypothetical protein